MLTSDSDAPGDPAAASSPPAMLHNGRRIETAWDVAEFLDVPYGSMSWILYRAPPEERYTPFEIPKRSGGMRLIHSPRGLVRQMQATLAPRLQAIYNAHPNAHGFIKARSVLTNARIHVGQRLVLNVDLQDFFPSINFGRVRGLFMKPPFSLGPAAAAVLAQLCTHRNGLPQGAATSPILSNFVASDLDRKLTRIAKETNTRYSRYADDITFSGNQASLPPTLVEFAPAEEDGALKVRVGEALERAIASSGFSVNHGKVRLQKRHERQTVTGLNVNQRANVTRKRIRKVRAMLHAWEKHGLEAAAREHFLTYRGLFRLPVRPERAYRNIVYGQLSFIKMVRGAEDPVFLNACAKILKLDPNPSRFVRQMVFGADDFDVFISHASEDKEEIARPVYEACKRLGLKVFLDEAHIGWGQSFTQKINTALGSARTVLCIISSTSVTKEWPVVEVNTALSLEVSGHKKVVPLLVGRPDLSRLPMIGGKDSMAWTGDANAVARRVKAAVDGNAPRRPDASGGRRSLATPGAFAEPELPGLDLPGLDRPDLDLPDLSRQRPRKRGFWGLFGGGRDKRK
jgi:RNA-directed DNA polymerase